MNNLDQDNGKISEEGTTKASRKEQQRKEHGNGGIMVSRVHTKNLGRKPDSSPGIGRPIRLTESTPWHSLALLLGFTGHHSH